MYRIFSFLHNLDILLQNDAFYTFHHCHSYLYCIVFIRHIFIVISFYHNPKHVLVCSVQNSCIYITEANQDTSKSRLNVCPMATLKTPNIVSATTYLHQGLALLAIRLYYIGPSISAPFYGEYVCPFM